MMWVTELSIKVMFPMQMFLFNLIILHGTGMEVRHHRLQKILLAYRHIPTDWTNTLHLTSSSTRSPGSHHWPTGTAAHSWRCQHSKPHIPCSGAPHQPPHLPQLHPRLPQTQLPQKCPAKDFTSMCTLPVHSSG